MNDENKFEFNTDFQENLLQYTVTDKNGHRIIGLYEDHYFTLLEHQVIAAGLKDYFKRKKRVPQSKTILKEHLRKIFLTKDFANAITSEDKVRVNKITTKIYRRPVKDGDDIFDSAIKFARYVKLKDTVEGVNLKSFENYDIFADKVRKAINIGVEFKEERGIFFIGGVRDRQYRRKLHDEVIPTPYRQMNRFTNAGGYPKSSLIVFLGPEKEFKTGTLINIARHNLRLRKKTLYIDLENGKDNVATRLDQSVMNKNKKEILSGTFDDQMLKQYRKYKRLGAEIDIQRFPSLVTNCLTLQNYIDDQYREFGIRYDDIIVDAPHLLGSTHNIQEEEKRISAVFMELKNFTEQNKFNICYAAAHTTRAAEKHFATKFTTADIAKCIDMARTVDAVWGYNRSELDIKLGIARLEIVDQRDGERDGAALFKVNYAHQRMDELSKHEVESYYSAIKKADPQFEQPKTKKDL